MPLSLTKVVPEILKSSPSAQFTARQLAEQIFKSFPAECAEKKAASKFINSDKDLVQQLVAEIGSQRPQMQKKHPQIKVSEGKPRKFYWSEKSDEAEVKEAETTQVSFAKANSTYSEADLYPILCGFIWNEFRVLGKRIDEKTGSNKYGAGVNRWLYPDVVGFERLDGDWDKEVRLLVLQTGDKRARFWSFEVKKILNISNVREAYFQAVSNSSWANRGYLVATQISENCVSELRMLYGLHGIGVIRLDVVDVSESQVLIPARDRPDVDWSAADRLANENKDFLTFIKNVRHVYQTGDVKQGDWDIPENPT